MEYLNGRRALQLCRADLLGRIAGYERVLLDLGAGDGRYVLDRARRDASCFVIGVDACREQLHDASRRAPHNALFVIANALQLPDELAGVVSELTINFPWGSLLRALLAGDAALFNGIAHSAQPGMQLCVRLNASALAELQLQLEHGGELLQQALTAHGLHAAAVCLLGRNELRRLASSWAKRIAYGRDPRALELRAAPAPRVRKAA